MNLAVGIIGLAFARAGRPAQARGLLKELQERAQTGYVLPSSFALIYFGLGEIEEDSTGWKERSMRTTTGSCLSAPTQPSIRCAPTRASTPCCAK